MTKNASYSNALRACMPLVAILENTENMRIFIAS